MSGPYKEHGVQPLRLQRIKYKLRSLKLQRGLFIDKQNLQAIAIKQDTRQSDWIHYHGSFSQKSQEEGKENENIEGESEKIN